MNDQMNAQDAMQNDTQSMPDPAVFELPVRKIFNTPIHYFYGAALGYAAFSIGSGLLAMWGVIDQSTAENAPFNGLIVGGLIGYFLHRKLTTDFRLRKEAELGVTAKQATDAAAHVAARKALADEEAAHQATLDDAE